MNWAQLRQSKEKVWIGIAWVTPYLMQWQRTSVSTAI